MANEKENGSNGRSIIPTATVSFLVGIALGCLTVIGVYSSRLAVIETQYNAVIPKINSIYDAMIRNGMIKPNLSAGAVNTQPEIFNGSGTRTGDGFRTRPNDRGKASAGVDAASGIGGSGGAQR